jgi:hypothetical protein
LAVLAIIASLVGAVVNSVNNLKSDLIASEANSIAKKALEISMFTYKGELLPNLSASFRTSAITQPGVLPRVNDIQCRMRLTNANRGRAVVSAISMFAGPNVNLTGLDGSPIRYPIVLGYNNYHVFLVDGFSYDPEYLAAIAAKGSELVDVYRRHYEIESRRIVL